MCWGWGAQEEKATGGHTGKAATCRSKRGASRQTKLGDTLLLDFQPPKLRKRLLLFQPPSLWHFDAAAQAAAGIRMEVRAAGSSRKSPASCTASVHEAAGKAEFKCRSAKRCSWLLASAGDRGARPYHPSTDDNYKIWAEYLVLFEGTNEWPEASRNWKTIYSERREQHLVRLVKLQLSA